MSNPRTAQPMRDLALTMIPLMLACLLVAGLARGCVFTPSGPSIDAGVAPAVNAAGELRRAAETVGFPVRDPRVPGWRATSFDIRPTRDGAGSPRAVRIGFLTPAGAYLRLVQSDADEPDLVEAETDRSPRATGPVRVAGAGWVVYPGLRDERVWVTDAAGVRILLTGSAGPAEFRTLAEATLAADPLPSRRS